MGQYLSLLRSNKLLTTAIVIGAPIIYLNLIHSRLSKTTHHITMKGAMAEAEAPNIQSTPISTFEEECFMIHDTALKPIPKALLPALDTKSLLNTYVRYTMIRFSYLPQAWILRLISDRQTFRRTT
jgi:hypothetical protein